MNKKTIISTLAVSALTGAMLFVAYAGTLSLLPSADGNYAAWTPKSGTTHYTLVDESACNGTTDYVSTGTVGARDSYVVSLAGIPDNNVITSIALKPCASQNSSGSASSILKVFYRLNGADSADAGSYSLSGTTPVDLATTTFSGLSITKSPTTALEIGAVLSSGSKGARLSKLAATITYVQQYTIFSSWTGNGTISPSGTSTVTQGGFKSFVVTAATSSVISDLIIDGVSLGATSSPVVYTFSNVQADHTISATFTP